MQQTFRANDKRGTEFLLIDPVVMGWMDRPTVELHGNGQFNIPPEAFEQLAVGWLRVHGYLVIEPDHVARAIAEKASQPVESLRPGY